jgi:pimeloyl-ACP methyl ester carboxylesterase
MANYVLIHGGNVSTETWNKHAKRNDYPPGGNLGGQVWDPIVSTLKAHDHRVLAPTLQDEHVCNLTDHVEQVCVLITEQNLMDIILAGHSYGGMVITGVADRMADRIRRLVYVDAAFPDPGQSLFDIIKSSGCDPLSFTGLERDAPYVEKLHYDPRKIEPLPKTYMLCTQSEFATVTHVAKEKIAAAPRGWTYIELPSSHLPMADMPESLAQRLLEAGL